MRNILCTKHCNEVIMTPMWASRAIKYFHQGLERGCPGNNNNNGLQRMACALLSQTSCASHRFVSSSVISKPEAATVKETEDKENSDPMVEMMKSPTSSALKTVKVIPGKGPPPEPPVECCMSGCANCVWIQYAEELKSYYADGGNAAREALEQIDNPSLKAFLKLELGL